MKGERATFARLRAHDWLAMALALVLLLVMAMDWYSTEAGENARDVQRATPGTAPSQAGDELREIKEDARIRAQEAERNAWQEDGLVDRLLLATLLATSGVAILAGFLRAAGRRYTPPRSPHTVAAAMGAASALLLAYRAIQEPGLDAATVIKSGLPLAALVLGGLMFACARAIRAEDDGSQFRPLAEPPPAPATRAT